MFFAQQVASELGLEAGKALKLESSSHLGYFLRLTRKVSIIPQTTLLSYCIQRRTPSAFLFKFLHGVANT